MGYSVVSDKDPKLVNVVFDTHADLVNLPTNYAVNSTAFCFEDSTYYKLNTKKKWVQIIKDGGNTEEGMFIGLISHFTEAFPTKRPNGDTLKFGDYVKVDDSAIVPFDIGGLHITSKSDRCVYLGGWTLEHGDRFSTDVVPVADPTTESISGTASYQNEVNKEVKEAVKPFKGTDGTTNGKQGSVPAPRNSDKGKYLKSDGTWSDVKLDSAYKSGKGINVNNTDKTISAKVDGKTIIVDSQGNLKAVGGGGKGHEPDGETIILNQNQELQANNIIFRKW